MKSPKQIPPLNLSYIINTAMRFFLLSGDLNQWYITPYDNNNNLYNDLFAK